jgi:hypothetical protein
MSKMKGRITVKTKETEKPGRLIRLEGQLRLLENASIGDTGCYGESKVSSFWNFNQWLDYAVSVTNPDEARNALYFGFQPLFDCLLRNELIDGERQVASEVLDNLVNIGREYLTGYYSGKPDTSRLRKNLENLAPEIRKFNFSAEYRTKSKNIDRNGIYPPGILLFLKRFLEETVGKRITYPDYVIGCACGSAEIAMPLSGLLDVNLGFIRRSHRRGDDYPKIIPEHLISMTNSVKNKHVVCIEDYVCTCNSLRMVMERTMELGARNVLGAGVNYSYDAHTLDCTKDEYKFKLFNLP